MHGLGDLAAQEPEEKMADAFTLRGGGKAGKKGPKKMLKSELGNGQKPKTHTHTHKRSGRVYPQSSLQQESDQAAVVVGLKLHRLQETHKQKTRY